MARALRQPEKGDSKPNFDPPKPTLKALRIRQNTVQLNGCVIRIVLVIITVDQAIKHRIVHHTTRVAGFENLVRIAHVGARQDWVLSVLLRR